MKKKVFRERYAESIKEVKTFDEKIENPGEVEVVKEEPKKRGRKKSVKSDE